MKKQFPWREKVFDDKWLPGRRCWDAGCKAGRQPRPFPSGGGHQSHTAKLPPFLGTRPGHTVTSRAFQRKQVWYRLQKGCSVHSYIEKFKVSVVSFRYETEVSALIFEWKDKIWISQRLTDIQTRLKAKHKVDVQKSLITRKYTEIWLAATSLYFTLHKKCFFEIGSLTELTSCKSEIS